MAFRLSDYVIGGFVINKGEYSTWGRLALRGYPDVVHLQLVGWPAEDLFGRQIEFDVAENERPATPEDAAALKGFRNRQIGATGCMTTARGVGAGIPRPGEPAAPEERCLYLEWFSQNGRVVIELPFSKVRFLTEEEIAERERLGREEFDEWRRQAEAERQMSDSSSFSDPLTEEDEDGEPSFNLIPPEFEREMEQKAAELDRTVLSPTGEEANVIGELELFDELIDGKRPETPVAHFLSGLEIPSPSSIQTDAEAEPFLKPLLARLAVYGTAMDTCKHCTPQVAYRLLVDKLLPELGVYEPLVGGDFVHHVCAYEVCEECRAEEENLDLSDPPF